MGGDHIGVFRELVVLLPLGIDKLSRLVTFFFLFLENPLIYIFIYIYRYRFQFQKKNKNELLVFG